MRRGRLGGAKFAAAVARPTGATKSWYSGCFKAPADPRASLHFKRTANVTAAAAAQCRGEKTARHGDRRSGLKKFTRESHGASRRRESRAGGKKREGEREKGGESSHVPGGPCEPLPVPA